MFRPFCLVAALVLTGCGGPHEVPSDGGAPPVEASLSSSGPPDAASLADDASTADTGTDASNASMPEAAAPAPPLVAYAGGYSGKIDWFSVDRATGALSPAGSVTSFGKSPSFLVHDPAMAHLYAVDEDTPGRVGAYSIDPGTGALAFLGSVSSGGNGPAYVGLDRSGKFVLVANYGDGTVSVLPVGSGGKLGAAVTAMGVGSEAHMIIADPTNHFVFVPCKGEGFVAQFRFDASTGALTPNTPPTVTTAKGAGPRHLAFHPNGRFAYLINETNSTLTAYALDPAGTLTEIETYSTLPDGVDAGTNAAAEVWVHPSGRWVVASNRGDETLVVFALDPATGKLTRKGFTGAGGTTPRDFAFDPTGTWLYAADQGTGVVAPFRFDATTGSLTPLAGAQPVSMASYVGLGELPPK
jgi:6-phosphogluconolactonase